MAVHFVRRNDTAYSSQTLSTPYSPTVLTDKFVVYEGTEIKLGTTYKYSDSSGKRRWYNDNGDEAQLNCVTFIATDGTVSVTPSQYWNATTKEYSIDGCVTWNTYTSGAITSNLVSFRGLNGTLLSATSSSTYEKWTITKNETDSQINCEGNIETLLDYEQVSNGVHPVMDNYCYNSMFRNCTSLASAPALPATTLTTFCYYSMFSGCTSLTTAPALPATTLTNFCYEYMFLGCTSLTTAPALPATTLTTFCYYSMFYGCTSLTTAPALPATTLAEKCYYSMFRGCTSLETAPALPATILASSCYNEMFYGCTSLTTAPTLSATTLASSCYSSMFRGCTSLTTAPTLSATTLASGCYYEMFYGCTSLTTAPALPATTLTGSCYEEMFYGCTSLITPPPTLSATILTGHCYASMFLNCKALTSAPIISATSFNNTYYSCNCMFAGCTNLKVSDSLPSSGGTLFFTCPTIELSTYRSVEYMFYSTGGTYTNDPKSGKSYYYYT